MSAKIEAGYRVGMLEVQEATAQRKGSYKVWRCRCDCGGERLLDTRALHRGTIRDCGCKSPVPPGASDLTGRRFGRLLALAPTGQRRYNTLVWRCRCDCGKEALLAAKYLLNGHAKSCGCLAHPPLKDFIGKRFGMLEVTAYEGKRAGMHRWRCRCDCGRETLVGQTLLQSGKTKSCGCLQAESYQKNLKLFEGTSIAVLESQRKKPSKANTSGYTGVYLDKRTGRWVAQIRLKGKAYYLGSFEKLEDAVRARQRGEEMHEEVISAYYQTLQEQ